MFRKILILTCLSIVALASSASVAAKSEFSLESLEQVLQDSEAKYSDIVKGAEKTVTWYAQKGQRTPLSIVYVHGFSATHKELSPMTELLAQRLQANIFYARLTGHGRSGDAMAEATVDAWKNDVREAYEIGSLLGDRVLLISTSTGGTLATWLNAQVSDDKLLANIMVSPNFGINGSGAWVLQWSLGLWLVKQLNGDYRGFTPQNEFHAMYWTERYPVEALVPMLDLLDEVVELDKSKISTPQLIIYSPGDRVIDVEKALNTAEEFHSSAVTTVPFTTSTDPGQHVLVGRGSTATGEFQEQVDIMLELLIKYVNDLMRTDR